MAAVRFYGTESDLIELMHRMEALEPMDYLETHTEPGRRRAEFHSFRDIPNFAHAARESRTASQAFCIKSQSAPFQEHAPGLQSPIGTYGGHQAIYFWPGGHWKDMLLYGEVSTAHASSFSARLMGRFRTYFKKANWEKIGAFHVGPGAYRMLCEGRRLTIAEQASREFDLKRV